MSQPILDNRHWFVEDYHQRLTTKQWKECLLDERDVLVFKGFVRKLVAKNIGAGVVEVYKEKRDA